ncbi:LysR family transcriptional regulator [Youngiibacter fragilis]|uniref:LysR family transcriptional regulator n=1 Tax=Youngiibacter fragilis 232.1 TaxID=994573 RepID=V7I0K5_9CLOT|nr:LysR family transcriptional regulator [Youngiibacter fragilis]ETA79760.1 LysR family transcriptional regulator [Youngiibacter fragilis 232.1]
MTLRHLRIFVKVCETGSVTLAGEELFIAQPSVSLAISELESYYGIKLFDRISRRLQITESGKFFLQYATHITGLFDEMEKGLKNIDATGTIRIGSSVTIGNHLLPGYIKAFREIYPEIRIEAVVDNSDRIEEHVLKNRLDFALVEGSVHSEYITGKRFMDDDLVVICSKDHILAGRDSVSPRELSSMDLLLRERGSAGRETLEGIFSAFGFEVRPTFESISTQAIVRAIEAGLGVSFLPYLLVKEDIEKGMVRMLKLEGASFERHFSIIHHKNKFITPGMQAFMDLCK